MVLRRVAIELPFVLWISAGRCKPSPAGLKVLLRYGGMPPMYGETDKLDEVKAKLNSVSPCFCMAKWMHTTLHLLNGHTHSCYLPQTHKVPLEEIQKDPSALHNTNHKKQQRKLMKEGVRPKECGMCWAIEDLPGNHHSDRILRGAESWTKPYFEQVKNMPWDQNINPTYMEVSFTSACNLKCSYCSPHVSSKWHEEIKQHGPYELSYTYQDTEHLRAQGLMPIEDEDQNPYVAAFWKWWPEAYKDLRVFRITGGEPLLSKYTFKVLEYINEHPNKQLEIDINSNLGVGDAVFERFVNSVGPILREGKVRSLRLHTSIDTYGAQAAYIRHGLNFERYERNLKTYLETFPQAGVAFMCTFNALSVVGFGKFLEWYLELRRKYEVGGRQVFLDIPHLTGPPHQSVRVLTPDYAVKLQRLIDKMTAMPEFRPMEVEKLKRIHQWMTIPQDAKDLAKNRKDFYRFFAEHDRRRGTDFLSVFPEMRDFWQFCQSLCEDEELAVEA